MKNILGSYNKLDKVNLVCKYFNALKRQDEVPAISSKEIDTTIFLRETVQQRSLSG